MLALLVRLSRNTLDAAVAAAFPVRLQAIFSPPYNYIVKHIYGLSIPQCTIYSNFGEISLNFPIYCMSEKEVDEVAYNYSELDGAITKVFGTRRAFARAMNLSEKSVSDKMNCKKQWKQSEMERACELLGESRDNIVPYFFNLIVQD